MDLLALSANAQAVHVGCAPRPYSLAMRRAAAAPVAAMAWSRAPSLRRTVAPIGRAAPWVMRPLMLCAMRKGGAYDPLSRVSEVQAGGD